jgi:hypothetical protein
MQCWQATGLDPSPAHGAACATVAVVVTNTDTGVNAMAAAATILKRLNCRNTLTW